MCCNGSLGFVQHDTSCGFKFGIVFFLRLGVMSLGVCRGAAKRASQVVVAGFGVSLSVGVTASIECS